MAGADAVMVHNPAPVVVPLAVPVDAPTVHGPDAEKLTGNEAEDDALTENPLPYCTLASGAKLMVCDCLVDPLGRMANVPDTGVAAL